MLPSYRTAIDHTAGYSHSWWKLIAFALQRFVDLSNICQVVSSFGSDSPRLDKLKHFGFDIGVDGDGSGRLKQRYEIVHELA